VPLAITVDSHLLSVSDDAAPLIGAFGMLKDARKWITRNSQKLLNYLIEDVHLGAYAVSFLAMIVGCAIFYAFLTPYGNGIAAGPNDPLTRSFPLALYFSVVTISSLGYGDFHPVGISKFLACVEVLFGLAVIGIVIAKVTSRRLSYHVKRLFATDANRRMEDFSLEFETSNRSFQEAAKKLAAAFQKTPKHSDAELMEADLSRDSSGALDFFSRVLEKFHRSVVSFCTHVSDECDEGDYVALVGHESAERIGGNIDQVAFTVGQLLLSVPAESRPEVLDLTNRKRLFEAFERQVGVCELFFAKLSDENGRQTFRRAKIQCQKIVDFYVAVPDVGDVQPDQILSDTDDPMRSDSH
jgi:hypothetical protein